MYLLFTKRLGANSKSFSKRNVFISESNWPVYECEPLFSKDDLERLLTNSLELDGVGVKGSIFLSEERHLVFTILTEMSLDIDAALPHDERVLSVILKIAKEENLVENG